MWNFMKCTAVGLLLLGGSALAEPNCCNSADKTSPQVAQEKRKMKKFTGKLEAMGMSIHMQGTHKLVDDSGEMIVILIAKDHTLDLHDFLGQNVEVEGEVDKSVEGDATVVTVHAIAKK